MEGVVSLPPEVPVTWAQSTLDAQIRQLFPYEWLCDFRMPYLDDLVNSAPFSTFAEWLNTQGYDASYLPGAVAGCGTPGQQACTLGRQGGAMTSKRAAQPLFEPGLSADAHFAAALRYGQRGLLPTEEKAVAPLDLRLAVKMTVANAGRLKDCRRSSAGAIRELSRRCQGLTAALRARQPETVRAVAGRVHVGLIAVLIVLAKWPDRTLARRFISGFLISGVMESTGIYDAVEHDAPASVESLLQGSTAMLKSLDREPFSVDMEFLWKSCEKEVARGWADPPLPREVLDSRFGRGRWAPIPTFVVTQQGGKRRRIDNGRRGGHNATTRFSEKMKMCTALQPAVDARLIAEEASARGMAPSSLQLLSGGEDMPDAFRSLPVAPEHLALNVAAVRDPSTWEWRFQVAWALLFGFSASVANFDRWSAFLAAVTRRVAWLPWSMYVDDGHLTELAQAGTAGQELGGCVFRELGTPLAPEKRQPVAAHGCFLGLEHDFGAVASEGCVNFCPKKSLLEKAEALIRGHLASNVLAPGDASKLRGLLTFMAQAEWLGVGRSVLRPLKQRQYWDVQPWGLSHTLRRALTFALQLLREQPMRAVPVSPAAELLIVIASDARADSSGLPTGGYILCDCGTGYKCAGHCTFPEELLMSWGAKGDSNPIALCEGQPRCDAGASRKLGFGSACDAGAMPPLVLERHLGMLAGRKVLFLLDNTVSLHSMVKGGASRC